MSERRQADTPLPLSGPAINLLSAHRRSNAIPDPTFERGLRRLKDFQRLESGRRTRRLAVRAGAAIVLAAAVILALLASPLLLDETPSGVREQAPYEHDGTAPEVPTKRRPVNADAGPSPASKSPTPAPEAPAAAVPPPAPSARPRPPKRLQPNSSTLAEERRVLQRAWQALAQGDPSAALAEAAEHERRFGGGVLANERSAIEAIANCKRGGVAPGARAAAYLDKTPDALLSSTVREACRDLVPKSPSP